jgi:hypothetical protein
MPVLNAFGKFLVQLVMCVDDVMVFDQCLKGERHIAVVEQAGADL